MHGMKAKSVGKEDRLTIAEAHLPLKDKINQCTNAIPTPNGAINIDVIIRVLEFCYKNTGYMWADKIASELLFCDFRDAKVEMERFFFKE